MSMSRKLHTTRPRPAAQEPPSGPRRENQKFPTTGPRHKPLDEAQESETDGLPPVVGKSDLKRGFGDEIRSPRASVSQHRHALADHGSAEPRISSIDISRSYQTGNAA